MTRAVRITVAAAVLLATIAVAVVIVRARVAEFDTFALASAEAAYAEGLALAKDDPAAARARFLESAAILSEANRGESTAALLYNRANALARAGEVGPAIAVYRAAAALSPADGRIAANLAETRASIARRIPPPPPSLLERASSVWGVLDESSRWIGAVLLLGVGAVLLIVTERPRHAAPAAAVIVALATASLLGSSVLLDQWRRAETARIVVLAEPTTLRKGNGEGFEPALLEPLPAGTEAIRTEARPGWLAITLGDGTTGWVPEAATARP
jgi:tetratricopeptide (TPR) repeat protein